MRRRLESRRGLKRFPRKFALAELPGQNIAGWRHSADKFGSR